MHRILKKVLHPQTYLSILERCFISNADDNQPPQFFILGLPRSGTTLVYQYLIHRGNFAYFTSGVGNYPYSPCLVSYFQVKLHPPYKSDFRSKYGHSMGALAPREAGSFWGRLFSFENYIQIEELSKTQIKEIRNTIYKLQQMLGGMPFLNKNVKHLLRIQTLTQLFPKACFLIVDRNLRDTGISVLRARIKNSNDENQWWSVKPENYETIRDLSVPLQVANQLTSLNKRLYQDLKTIPKSRIISINYEEFCGRPESLIENMMSIYPELEIRNKRIDSFEVKKNKIENDTEEALVNYLTKSLKKSASSEHQL